ncbi:heptose II phosphotransferase [Marinobacter daqiaonensis]|uniref:Heptose II phosphotransferase n=1 Tax=Marinobacter daqiaonensis TaxID=650891 RepID=A0A1I6K274_9GAMM|nr:lipopolysaccharide core heptose(II) kinase RfaY [Marinobacter daqiaonensis]SFR85333.1 heptose II phosphotransferase [Marinobacter daqiaonensis]
MNRQDDIDLSHRGYHLRINSELGADNGRRLLDDILDNTIEYQRVFKDHARTLSVRVDFDQKDLLLKVPRARNRRGWERMLTLFRSSEGLRTFQNLKRIRQLGFFAPTPVLAAEKRRFGMVTDSLVCYEFAEGRPAADEDAPQVLEALRELHSLGAIRTDPQPANFLISDDRVIFIDFRLKIPRILGSLRTDLELAKFLRVFPAARHHLPQAKMRSASFRRAEWLERRIHQFREQRRALKRRLTR